MDSSSSSITFSSIESSLKAKEKILVNNLPRLPKKKKIDVTSQVASRKSARFCFKENRPFGAV
jgi:hypothetical protein